MLKEYAKELLSNGLDGKEYFNLVDEFIRNSSNLIDRICQLASHELVASGKIGIELISKGKNIALIIPGGLRKGVELDLSKQAEYINGKEFTFIDDSYYSGTTYFAIKNEIEKYGGRCEEVIVAYDGGYHDNVKSLVSYKGLLKQSLEELEEES